MKRSPILLAMLFLVACDGGVSVRGVVRDTAGNPIAARCAASGEGAFLRRLGGVFPRLGEIFRRLGNSPLG